MNKLFDTYNVEEGDMTIYDTYVFGEGIMTKIPDDYIVNGWADREDYLRGLAEIYEVPYPAVRELADLLGPSEDFNGLISAVQDRAPRPR